MVSFTPIVPLDQIIGPKHHHTTQQLQSLEGGVKFTPALDFFMEM